ncbi:hypothetical protein [Streptomyces sp. NPDC057494]|uniref:hypothetical protein n=1 Tax=Streptomyces sp. NPDC057494 TaxID=3346148 RepID=UPI0036B36AC3
MRHELRTTFGAAILLVTTSTGCSAGEGGSAVPSASRASASTAAPSASPQDLTEVTGKTHETLTKSVTQSPDAPGPQGLMLVEVWPAGAAYAWETRDQRLCSATVTATMVREKSCATRRLDPPVTSPSGLHPIFTLFTDGWVRLFGADHQQVTAATCSGTPLKVRKVGTVAGGARTLYAAWFPDYTKGSIELTLSDGGTTSKAPLALGDAGDRTCSPAS